MKVFLGPTTFGGPAIAPKYFLLLCSTVPCPSADKRWHDISVVTRIRSVECGICPIAVLCTVVEITKSGEYGV